MVSVVPHCFSVTSLPIWYVLPPKVVFFDNGRLVWEAGSNRRIDVSGLSSTTDGHFTLYWGAPGVTPLIAIPRVEPELVEGEIVEVGPEGEGKGERGEAEAVRQTVVLQDEDNEEQQVCVCGGGVGVWCSEEQQQVCVCAGVSAVVRSSRCG